MYLKPTAHWSTTATMIALLPSSRRQRVTEKEHGSIVQTFVISLRISPATETETETEQSFLFLSRRKPKASKEKPERPKVKSKYHQSSQSLHPSTLLFPGLHVPTWAYNRVFEAKVGLSRRRPKWW
jgi:hypothetical protein